MLIIVDVGMVFVLGFCYRRMVFKKMIKVEYIYLREYYC